MPCSFLYCLFTNAVWCSSSLSVLISGLSIIGIIPLIGQVNSNVAGLERPCPGGVDFICSRAMCMSLPESKHFFMVHFMNFMQASTHPLLWQWYNDNTACSIFRFLQIIFALFWNKIATSIWHYPLGMPYSENTTLNADIKLSADNPFIFLTIGNLLWQSITHR